MKILVARPPLFDDIVKAFPGAAKPGIFFAWGDTIYNPSNVVIPQWKIEHEKVHGHRQTIFDKGNVAMWWMKYIDEKQFRLDEEVQAYIAELNWLYQFGNRLQRRAALKTVAGQLSSPLYGPMVTSEQARFMLRRREGTDGKAQKVYRAERRNLVRGNTLGKTIDGVERT